MWNVPQKCCQSLGQILILQEQKCAVIDVQKMITNFFFFFLITKLVEDGKVTKITATIQEEHQICSSLDVGCLGQTSSTIVLFTSWKQNLGFFWFHFLLLKSSKYLLSSLFCLSKGLGTHPGNLVCHFTKSISDVQSQSGSTDSMVMPSLSCLLVEKIGLIV